MDAPLLPKRIDQHDPRHFRIEWTDKRNYLVPFVEVRFNCPCAGCVDEHTGVRTLRREEVPPAVRPENISLVGRYALQINWSDQHRSGMFSFDQLRKICVNCGQETS
jgi:DUF971 family protein